MTFSMKKKHVCFLSQVIALMKKSLHDENFELAHIWQEMGLSRTNFYRKFESIGEQPLSLLYHLRLEKAAELLVTTELSVSEIAFYVGFKNTSHFSRKFSEKFKVTPTEYRNMNLG